MPRYSLSGSECTDMTLDMIKAETRLRVPSFDREPKSTLLDLPAELRVLIYEFCFTSLSFEEAVRRVPRHNLLTPILQYMEVSDTDLRLRQPALLQTCRLVRKEALPIYTKRLRNEFGDLRRKITAEEMTPQPASVQFPWSIFDYQRPTMFLDFRRSRHEEKEAAVLRALVRCLKGEKREDVTDGQDSGLLRR